MLLNKRTLASTLAGAVAYGLVGRLAFSESLPIAVPMTFAFIFLVPLAVGYLAVAGAAPPASHRASPGTGRAGASARRSARVAHCSNGGL